MKLLRLGIRFWITLSSVISFLTGWILIAHAPNPAEDSSSSNTPLHVPTLEPLRPLSVFGTNNDDFQNAPSFNVQPRPFFRSGGS